MFVERDTDEQLITIYRSIVRGYLKYGSLERFFETDEGLGLPVSYPQAQRVLNRWEIVKRPTGRSNTFFSEVVSFLQRLAVEKGSLESLYRKMPLSFRTSVATLHRVLGRVRDEKMRREGAAVVVTSEGFPNEILVANDISTPRPELGKPYGSLTIPMVFAAKGEPDRDKLVRAMQQEMFAMDAVNRTFPWEVVPDDPAPFMTVDVADVRVNVFQLVLGQKTLRDHRFTSYKLRDYRLMPTSALKMNRGDQIIRAGLSEIVDGYLDQESGVEHVVSDLNLALMAA